MTQGMRTHLIAAVTVVLTLLASATILASFTEVRKRGPVGEAGPLRQPEPLVSPPSAAAASSGLSESGFPRSYQMGISVSTYSLVNTAWGNLLTVVPITGWSGRGPDLDFNLYHNSYDGIWRTSYSANIRNGGVGEKFVVTDDGMEIKFTLVNAQWTPEPGFHSTLVHQAGNTWRWTLEDQTVFRFDSNQLLVSITDAAGNNVTVYRDGGHANRITSIQDATGRSLGFVYDPGTNLLSSIQEGFTLPGLAGPRTWSFTYDGNNLFERIIDPIGNNINVSLYDTNGRIKVIADKNGNSFSCTYYSNGRIQRITDPAPFSTQIQQFSYTTFGTFPFQTNYTDRRGGLWKFGYSDGTRQLKRRTNPFGKYVSYVYDTDLNVTRYTNELFRHWFYTYDSNGNMLSATDPSNQMISLEYDSLNNVTLFTDADSNVTEYRYEVPDIDPTVPTSIILPPMEDPQEPEADRTISLAYFGGESDCCTARSTASCADDQCELLVCDTDPFCCNTEWDSGCATLANQDCAICYAAIDANGLLRYIIDAEGVETHFYYDSTGQLSREVEGPSGLGTWSRPVSEYIFDQGSRLIGGGKGCESGTLSLTVGHAGGTRPLAEGTDSLWGASAATRRIAGREGGWRLPLLAVSCAVSYDANNNPVLLTNPINYACIRHTYMIEQRNLIS